MGQVSNSLYGLLQFHRPDFVHQDRESDREGPVDSQRIKADAKGVADGPGEVDRGEKVAEMLEQVNLAFDLGPRASEDALAGREVLESDDDAVHGPVQEHREVDEYWKCQQVEAPVIA